MGRKKYKHHASAIKSAERIKTLLRENYEPGRQDKCKLAVYRNKIRPLTAISERTFWRYMHEVEQEMKQPEDKRQMKLF
jgi:hypothetical protein